MSLPSSLRVALKEWDVVCRALAAGEQIILLRKGGIHDVEGVFQLEEQQFLLFRTFLHQNPEMLKPAARAGLVSRSVEPEVVSLAAAAEVTDVVRVKDRAQVDALDDQHIWAKAQIDMRFNYKPQNPLYLVLLRVYRLREPVEVANTPAYAGCKSWVPLDVDVPTAKAVAALDDGTYARRRAAVLEKLQ